MQDVKIDENEHKDFVWVSSEDALKMNLIEDEDYCIQQFSKAKNIGTQ
ncbi:hypothetical protein HYZ41_04855 [archaeon]|nr:hypothetical protein [archaeon]